jgi:phosphatidylglycerol:prolipoprotein diacylglycerol transferase
MPQALAVCCALPKPVNQHESINSYFMLTYPQIDPVALALGPLKIHWYALTYLFGFSIAWWLGNRRADQSGSSWTRQQVADLITNSMLGVILGGRIGYVLFYDFADFIAEPAMIFRVWQGGMSFHGGFLGVVIAVMLFAHFNKKSVIQVLDFTAPLAPLGLGAGRIGNFINGELWGRATDVPWAMVFPADSAQLPRHPSQLYEFALEGLLLFALLWWFSSKPRPAFATGALFCIGYGSFRFGVEFFREPDLDLGYVAFNWVTQGQLLSAPMIVFGLIVLLTAYTKPQKSRGRSS